MKKQGYIKILVLESLLVELYAPSIYDPFSPPVMQFSNKLFMESVSRMFQ